MKSKYNIITNERYYYPFIQKKIDNLSNFELREVGLKIINDANKTIYNLSKNDAPNYIIESITNLTMTLPVEIQSSLKGKVNDDKLKFEIKNFVIGIRQIHKTLLSNKTYTKQANNIIIENYFS